MIILDTDTCVEILRGNGEVLRHRDNVSEDVGIGFITVAELFYGAEKSSRKEENRLLVEHFLLSLPVIESDEITMRKFGQLKAVLEKQGVRRSDADLLVASTTLIHGSRLITGNARHFEDIPGLLIENWIR